MNLIERFFRDITEDVVCDGSFTSVQELKDDIETYMVEGNLEPKRYLWKAEGKAILQRLHRARQILSNLNKV